MANHHPSPTDLDTRDPEFQIRWRAWAEEFNRDVAEVVATTKQTIATSQALLTNVERLLRR
jgi:hypothetical protein